MLWNAKTGCVNLAFACEVSQVEQLILKVYPNLAVCAALDVGHVFRKYHFGLEFLDEIDGLSEQVPVSCAVGRFLLGHATLHVLGE